jgi:hypothetical protein
MGTTERLEAERRVNEGLETFRSTAQDRSLLKVRPHSEVIEFDGINSYFVRGTNFNMLRQRYSHAMSRNAMMLSLASNPD